MQLATFLSGMACTLSAIAALIFIRSYYRTRDRLFAFFAASFIVQVAGPLLFLITQTDNEAKSTLYGIRLVAFGLIIFAIIDKNRVPKNTLPK